MVIDKIKVGDQFGMWVVIGGPTKVNGTWKYACRCDCGTERDVSAYDLAKGKSKSCGCITIDHMIASLTKHGKCKTSERREPLYVVWQAIRSRCNNQNNKSYANYGGRGIKMCHEWDDYSSFRNWALSNGYEKGLSIDRINNDGNYEPENCRWTTTYVQNNNSRHNRIVDIDGVKMNRSTAERLYGIKKSTVSKRLQYGWDLNRAITQPVDKNKIAKRFRDG